VEAVCAQSCCRQQHQFGELSLLPQVFVVAPAASLLNAHHCLTMKRLYFLIVAVGVLTTQWMQAQTNAQTIIQTPQQADSLRRVLAATGSGTVRVATLNALAFYFGHTVSQYDSALHYAQRAQNQAREIGSRQGVAEALNTLANVYRNQGKYSEALEQCQQSLGISEALHDKRGVARALNIIGNTHRNQGKFTVALGYLFRALPLAEQAGDKHTIATTLYYVSMAYRGLRKFDEALQYCFSALRIRQELDDKRGIAGALHNLSVIYRLQKRYDEALKRSEQSLAVSREIGDQDDIGGALHSTTEIYSDMGNKAQTLHFGYQAFSVIEHLGHKEGAAGLLVTFAGVHYLLGAYDSAQVYAFRAIALADAIGLRSRKAQALDVLRKSYESLGQHKLALEYYRRYVTLRDSVMNLDNLNMVSALKEEYEAEKREQQIALLSKEKEILNKEKEILNKEKALFGKEKDLRELTLSRQEAELTAAHARDEQNKQSLALAASERERQNAEFRRRSVIQWSLMGFLALMVVSALWLWRLNRQRLRAYRKVSAQQKILEVQATEIQQANLELHQQNEELSALNAEKNELMGILAHDLKNPIGAVRGLAELIQEDFMEPAEVPTVSGQIVTVADRMFELVKNLLDLNHMESGGMHIEMMKFDIAPMVESTVWQYASQAKAKNITLHFESTAEHSVVHVGEQAVMQVLDNLISNAVKYSPHGKNIFVRLKSSTEAGSEAVRVEIQDEGPGISAEDQKKLFGKFARLSAQPTGGEHSTGLGLSIVKKMVEAMNGRVWCESVLGKGATFVVELPKAQA
jgi:signal transduction histidine kinase